MRISDEERREVAARMRKIMRDDPHGWLDVMVAKAVADVMGDGEKIGETVADLIDRPTCRNIYAETVKVGACENGFKCSECWNARAIDRDDLLKVADECANADVDCVIDWAERIRKAVG